MSWIKQNMHIHVFSTQRGKRPHQRLFSAPSTITQTAVVKFADFLLTFKLNRKRSNPSIMLITVSSHKHWTLRVKMMWFTRCIYLWNRGKGAQDKDTEPHCLYSQVCSEGGGETPTPYRGTRGNTCWPLKGSRLPISGTLQCVNTDITFDHEEQ